MALTDDEIAQAAIAELRLMTLGTTDQLLKIHDVVRAGGMPVVERIDRESVDERAIVYFGIQGEKFHLAAYVDTSTTPSVCAVATEPHHDVYLRVVSEVLDSTQMAALTTLVPTRSWNKGDEHPRGRLRRKVSMIEFRPNLEPDALEDKLKSLAALLERDKEGVKSLVDTADAFVQVVSYYHNGNGMIGGFHLDKEVIRRMAALDLEIDFDMYVGGNRFK